MRKKKYNKAIPRLKLKFKYMGIEKLLRIKIRPKPNVIKNTYIRADAESEGVSVNR